MKPVISRDNLIAQLDSAINNARATVDWKQATAIVILPRRRSIVDEQHGSVGYPVTIQLNSRHAYTYYITEEFQGLYSGASGIGWSKVEPRSLSDKTLELVLAALQEHSS